ncbi:MAG: oxygen-independent coproporphyrinogen III oxidase [Deltaproteobacteria bacterium]|nr:oxygen-independent coproporphyrinogen III oxidase [Deltaproteobacteria bacterium]
MISKINLEVLKRYDKPGPRYTSYPTAPKFSKDFGPAQFEEELRQSNKKNQGPLSLYFHIPFCDTLCYFCGCTMMVTHERQKIADYLTYLEKEIQLVTKHVSKNRPVYQLHWGGGTPTYLNPDEIRHLGSLIQNHFNFDQKELEASSEIDPRDLTRDHIVALKEAGFNRLSMGVQDFEERVQKAVNRLQPESVTRAAVDWGRELGFHSINLDLIYGLPFQTLQGFEKTLDKIIEINPDRLAIFNYAHVPWLKKHMNLIKAEDLPTPDQKLMILKMTIEKLQAAGYQYIGMDHFAKPTDELAIAQKNKTLFRNFQGYSTKAGTEVYAMGMSAISQLNEVYAQNAKTLPEYYQAISEGHFATSVGYRMNRDDHIRKKVIMTLMCDFELDEKEIEKEFNISFENYFAESLPKLAEFINDGFVIRKDKKIFVEGMGRLLIRNIVMVFDAYLGEMMKEKPVFSRTV